MDLVAPGYRTAPARGRRAAILAALSVAVGQPRLWLLGALGFASRGGLVVLALPILTIPGPVILSTVFRGQISTTGIAPGMSTLAPAVAVLGFVVVILALLAAASADVAAFEALAMDRETDELRWGRDPVPFTREERVDLVVTLAAIQVVALVPAALVAAVVASRAQGVFLAEWILPSDLTAPFFLRVIAGLRDPLLALGAALVLADLVYAVAGRAVLVGRSGLGGRPAPGRRAARVAAAGLVEVLRRPWRMVATQALAGIVTVVVLVPTVWASTVAWNGVRSVFLSADWGTDPGAVPAAIIVTAVFAGIWVAVTILAGFASAMRAALWSADALR